MKQRLCHFYRMVTWKTVKEQKGHEGCYSSEHELQYDVVANRADVISRSPSSSLMLFYAVLMMPSNVGKYKLTNLSTYKVKVKELKSY